MKDSNNIKCPNCGAEINVSDILYHQVQEKLKKEFEIKNAEKENEYSKKLSDLNVEKELVAKEKLNINQQVDNAVKIKLVPERANLEKAIRRQVDTEMSDEVKKSRTELQKKDKLIGDLNKRLEDTQNKLRQGSNKLTGEVKEIELRDFLKSNFPMDEIKDIPSGVSGADLFQIVKNNSGQINGTILYERKETLLFGKDWISKLKEDGRRIKADICVIVTKTLPRENPHTHFNEGVWVCTFEDIKLITTLLRDGLIKQYTALKSQSDKGSKMEMLYDYLNSNDFKNHILGILDAFKKMDNALNKDRDDSLKKFAEREAHIFQAKQSIINFCGRVDGIVTDSLTQEMNNLKSLTLKTAQLQL